VLWHDDNMDGDDLGAGFTATKAAFEAKWDMLYNPPLTQKVGDAAHASSCCCSATGCRLPA
jgi:hypothetical protein